MASNTTNKTRIQVPLEQGTYERVTQLAEGNRRTLGAMCVELIEHALESEQFKRDVASKIKEMFKSDTVGAAIEGVDLDRDKLRKLMKLLEAID